MSRGSKQRRFNTIVLVAMIIVIVAITAYAFTRSTSVALPEYLNRCIPYGGPYAYRSIPALYINITGSAYQVPANIGVNGNCFRPIFTLGNTGAIHILTDVNRNYTLGDFFLVWGNTYGVQFATFNQDQILGFKTDQYHNITMYVNHAGTQVQDTSFQNYVFPRDANDTNFYIIDITYS